ncbi:MAG: potassium channel family protein [Halieaceae bacterium]
MPNLTPHITDQNNFTWLLGALVFFLFAGAVADQFALSYTNLVINVALMITLVVNIWAVDNQRTKVLSWKVGATFVIALTMITDSVIESNVLAKFQLILSFVFLCLTTWQAWNQVMFTGRVNSNKIIGAICIYLLIGLAWGFAYLIVEAFIPNSMHGLEQNQWQHNTDDLIYYSMVTLTTLGYGDITPAQPIVRFLAYMESVTGIFYTTVLVASLIGIRLAGVDSSKALEKMDASTQTDDE